MVKLLVFLIKYVYHQNILQSEYKKERKKGDMKLFYAIFIICNIIYSLSKYKNYARFT